MRRSSAALALPVVFAFACSDGTVLPPTSPESLPSPSFSVTASNAQDPEAIIRRLVEDANARLESEGANVRIERAFYYTASHEQGQTIFFNDRTLQLPIHFVAGDPRRVNGDDIAYMIDQVQLPTGFDAPTVTAAGDRAMATWDGVQCSTIPITPLPNIPALDIGLAFGGFPSWLLGADITHAGWVPTLGGTTLGLSIPFGFIDGSGNFTDINNDGKIDTAFWEIYYSNAFTWADDGVNNIDIQTVMLHEAAHGLDQGHFGKLFRTDANGRFHFAPRAVMNAGYTGPQRTIGRTDEAGHCGIWGRWPRR